MTIICLQLTCLALAVVSILTSATIGMMSKRIKQLEKDIDKLNENNKVEVKNE